MTVPDRIATRNAWGRPAVAAIVVRTLARTAVNIPMAPAAAEHKPPTAKPTAGNAPKPGVSHNTTNSAIPTIRIARYWVMK